ncbi:hypothetical protein AMTRI_Chr06g192020 [Amborella trichopoda]
MTSHVQSLFSLNLLLIKHGSAEANLCTPLLGFDPFFVVFWPFFAIILLDPATKKEVHFLKYRIYVGGNRGRGQIYPDGSKSNNTIYNASALGIISRIIRNENGGYEITIANALDGRESIKLDQPLAKIVLQDPLRFQGLLLFLAFVILAQIFLVLKKKHFEKVQLEKEWGS